MTASIALRRNQLRLMNRRHTNSERIIRESQRGFTLIEILVVVMIIGMLAAMVGPAVMRRADGARKNTAKVQIENLVNACNIFKLDTGTYPSSLEGLVNDPGVTGWDGPYLDDGKIPLDPWNQPFEFQSDRGSVTIVSTGSGERISNRDDG